jgi:hypothetical protein
MGRWIWLRHLNLEDDEDDWRTEAPKALPFVEL